MNIFELINKKLQPPVIFAFALGFMLSAVVGLALAVSIIIFDK